MALFSRYPHRHCIINCKCGCQGSRTERPGEDLQRLNFPRRSWGRARAFAHARPVGQRRRRVRAPPAAVASISRTPLSLSAVCARSQRSPWSRGPDGRSAAASSLSAGAVPHFAVSKNVSDTWEIGYHVPETSRRDTDYQFNRNSRQRLLWHLTRTTSREAGRPVWVSGPLATGCQRSSSAQCRSKFACPAAALMLPSQEGRGGVWWFVHCCAEVSVC